MEMNTKELLAALEGLEREKNIKRDDILKTIEDSLVSALRKNLGKMAQITAKINVATGTIDAAQQLTVVKAVSNPEMEIDLAKSKSAEDWAYYMIKRLLLRVSGSHDNFTLICGRIVWSALLQIVTICT